MRLAKYRLPNGGDGVAQITDEGAIPLDLAGGRYRSLFEILESENPEEVVSLLTQGQKLVRLSELILLPPIDQQEVWAAGVTYKRSKVARMEESTSGASFYDMVYASPRPELFFKATPHRVAGHDQIVRIRSDANWNVPEPELALVLNSRLKIVGYTIGNDMSSRDIEGQNPLYLPQAKVYDQCCGLGPWISLETSMPPREHVTIQMNIRRGEDIVFHGQTDLTQLARTPENLVSWLARDNSFPHGAFLLTGTGIVPDNNFTLKKNDVVEILIAGIGALINTVG